MRRAIPYAMRATSSPRPSALAVDRPRAFLSGCVLVLAATLAACGGGDESTEPQLISFSQQIGGDSARIYSAGGLTIEAECSDSPGVPSVSLSASTATDDAWIASEFDAKGAPPAGYRFIMDDFDTDFGPWDFLGSGIEKATGTLTYVSETDGQVTIDFVADRGTSQADCLFSGSATHVAE